MKPVFGLQIAREAWTWAQQHCMPLHRMPLYRVTYLHRAYRHMNEVTMHPVSSSEQLSPSSKKFHFAPIPIAPHLGKSILVGHVILCNEVRNAACAGSRNPLVTVDEALAPTHASLRISE